MSITSTHLEKLRPWLLIPGARVKSLWPSSGRRRGYLLRLSDLLAPSRHRRHPACLSVLPPCVVLHEGIPHTRRWGPHKPPFSVLCPSHPPSLHHLLGVPVVQLLQGTVILVAQDVLLLLVKKQLLELVLGQPGLLLLLCLPGRGHETTVHRGRDGGREGGRGEEQATLTRRNVDASSPNGAW
jgi:hypothetical protein